MKASQINYSKKVTIIAILPVLLLLVVSSCDQDNYMPKPRGYFRIDLPAQGYRPFDSTFPFRFEYPVCAKITSDEYTRSEPYWLNIEYPAYKGKIHLSYKDVRSSDLAGLIEDSRSMAYKHAPKAIGIKESIVTNPKNKIYGTVYTIEGRDAASPFQFYVTDSTHHFLRGALYFYTLPNNDSLQHVIDFIIDDVDHLIGTLEWK